jgi:hypothetical protein
VYTASSVDRDVGCNRDVEKDDDDDDDDTGDVLDVADDDDDDEARRWRFGL